MNELNIHNQSQVNNICFKIVCWSELPVTCSSFISLMDKLGYDVGPYRN